MRTRFKKRIKGTIKAVTFSAVCCTVIYASVLLLTAKSLLKMQTSPVDY